MTYRETAPLRNARYSAFGLTIESEMELPELPSCDAAGPADVEIRFGAVDERLEDGIEIDRDVRGKPGAAVRTGPGTRERGAERAALAR